MLTPTHNSHTWCSPSTQPHLRPHALVPVFHLQMLSIYRTKANTHNPHWICLYFNSLNKELRLFSRTSDSAEGNGVFRCCPHGRAPVRPSKGPGQMGSHGSHVNSDPSAVFREALGGTGWRAAGNHLEDHNSEHAQGHSLPSEFPLWGHSTHE